MPGFANDFLIERNGGPGIKARLNAIVSLGPSVKIRPQGGSMQLSDGSVVFVDALSGYISSFGGEFPERDERIWQLGPRFEYRLPGHQRAVEEQRCRLTNLGVMLTARRP